MLSVEASAQRFSVNFLVVLITAVMGGVNVPFAVSPSVRACLSEALPAAVSLTVSLAVPAPEKLRRPDATSVGLGGLPLVRWAPCGTRYQPTATTPLSSRSEEHTSELQSLRHLVCRLLLEKKNKMPFLTDAVLDASCALPPTRSPHRP